MEPTLAPLRDAACTLPIAAIGALVVWLLPFAGVPVLALITGPLGLALLRAGRIRT